ncbi:hypothetical protein [Antarctobacter jejuensis]
MDGQAVPRPSRTPLQRVHQLLSRGKTQTSLRLTGCGTQEWR